jgi:hypothetical protein
LNMQLAGFVPVSTVPHKYVFRQTSFLGAKQFKLQ